MAGRLQAEIKQKKPFRTLEQEAFLNLLRTTDALLRGQAKVLKSVGLSHPQYNVLRILRGAGPHGLACREVCERVGLNETEAKERNIPYETSIYPTDDLDRKDRRVV